ncbi:MAG: DUF3488 and transglutaminase-like domain-containing protein [Cellvibrionales bacterium]|nr:DUF3488 and transglutaminase-like domain-containing protein [Cellvibrionales bacterium]
MMRRAAHHYQIPRTTFLWLVAVLVFLMLPHAVRFSLVIVPLLVICIVWRWLIFKQKVGHPSFLLRAALVVFGFAAVYLLPFEWVSLETAVAILLVGTLLKLLEMRHMRDLLVMSKLCYFVIVAQLLFDQSMLSAVYMLIGIALATASLVSLNLRQKGLGVVYPAKLASKMMLLSVPIMALGFLLFPRLEPFWRVPLPEKKSTTGISDTMTPGSIGELIQSNALVFRATFKDKVTDTSEFYWRGPVLSYFDGQTWHGGDDVISSVLTGGKIDSPVNSLAYDVIMEASYTDWLFPLETYVSSHERLHFASDYSLKARSPINKKRRFSFVSNDQVLLDLSLPDKLKSHYLELPKRGNPKAREFAEQLRRASNDEASLISHANAFFQSEPFVYTLKPPVYSTDRVDRFLFDGQAGFCEHYASSYVFLMRAAGVPARIITGYQGGEVNPYEGYVAVRQKDAHAWVEVWLSGKGWIRIDPTSFVAPHRVRLGIMEGERYDQLQTGNWQPRERWFGQETLEAIAHRYDQLGYIWSNVVVGFDAKDQWALITGLLGLTTWLQKALWLIAAFVGCFLVIYFSLVGLPRRNPLPLHEKLYVKCIKKLQKQGVEKPVGVGPRDFLILATEKLPDKKEALDNFIQAYIRLTYQPENTHADSLQLMKQWLKRM